jgi:Na+/H+ antiporter NhaB
MATALSGSGHGPETTKSSFSGQLPRWQWILLIFVNVLIPLVFFLIPAYKQGFLFKSIPSEEL